MPVIQLLRQTKPDWFLADAKDGSPITGEATVLAPGAAQDWRIRLTIAVREEGVSVSPEVAVGELPKFCPQRHINEDGSFCTGYRAGHEIANHDRAVVWWGLLHKYLELQRAAGRTRRWPARQALAHGVAGAHQILAQAAAGRLGVLGQYMDMLDGHEFWLSSRRIQLNKNSDGLVNGRAACPVGCKRKKNSPRLRRECCRKTDLVAVVAHERLRRLEERNYWSDLRKRRVECCGTMKNCPLGDSDSGPLAA